MATRAASVFVKLGVDAVELTRGLDKAKKSASTWEKATRKAAVNVAKGFAAVTVAGTAAAAALTSVWRSTAPLIDNLAKTSDKLGTTTEGLQAVRFAGEKAGISITSIDTALQRQTRRLAEAAQGTGTLGKELGALGLDAKELVRQRPEQALVTILDTLRGIPNQAERVRIAFKVFDTEGVGLVNLTSEAIKEAAENLDAVGASLSRLDAAKVEAANDAFTDLKLVTQGFRNRLTVQLAEPLRIIASNLFEAAKQGDSVDDALSKLINSALRGLGSVAISVGEILRFIDGREEILQFGIIGYMFYGKKGLIVGSLLGELADTARVNFNIIRNFFDDTRTEKELLLDELFELDQRLENNIANRSVPLIGKYFKDKSQELNEQIAETEERLKSLGHTFDDTASVAVIAANGFTILGESLLKATEGGGGASAPRLPPNLGAPGADDPVVNMELYRIDQLRKGWGDYYDFRDKQRNDEIKNEKAAGDKKTEIDYDVALLRLNIASNLNKAFFKNNKDIAIAIAITEGIVAVQRAWSGYVWPLNILPAANAAAFALANVQQIRSTGVGSAGSVTSPNGGTTTPASPVLQEQSITQQQPTQVSINVFTATGASQDQIDQAINEAVRRNVENDNFILNTPVIFNTAAA